MKRRKKFCYADFDKQKRSFISETPFFELVRRKGLEPPRLSALDPKSSAATNYATSA